MKSNRLLLLFFMAAAVPYLMFNLHAHSYLDEKKGHRPLISSGDAASRPATTAPTPPTATTAPTPPTLPPTAWRPLCQEGHQYPFHLRLVSPTPTCSEGSIVRYGAAGGWAYRKRCEDTPYVRCATQTFGKDPADGAPKGCECLDTAGISQLPDSERAAFADAPCLPPHETRAQPIGPHVQAMLKEPAVDSTRARKDFLAAHPDGKQENPDPSACRASPSWYQLLRKIDIETARPPHAPRLLCLFYTMATKGDGHRAILNTFGPSCDGLLFMSTETHPEKHQLKVHKPGEESYHNMWQKSRAIWAYVEEWQAGADLPEEERYDYFVIGGEDLYVIPENMRKYLASQDVAAASEGGTKPLFLGRRFREPGGMIFNSGGAGYVLNRAALSVFASLIDTQPCAPAAKTSAEDVNLAKCLLSAGVQAFDTRDASQGGANRFMCFTPDLHYGYSKKTAAANDWFHRYFVGEWREGLDDVSTNTVSFHYMKPDVMARTHAVLFHCGK